MKDIPSRKKKYTVNMICRSAMLPPVRDVLVIGKKTPVGAKGVVEAMQAMTPGMFRHITVDHPVIDSLLVRESDLRKIPERHLVAEILECAEGIMDESDALSIDLDVQVFFETSFGDRD